MNNSVIPFPAQTPIDASALALQFLKLLLPSAGGYYASAKPRRGKWYDRYHGTIEDLRTDLLEADRSEGDAYFAVASFSSNASRTIDNVFKLRALRLDIDYGEHHRSKAVYATRLEALAAIERFRDAVGLPEPMIVESGGGLHCYWPLKEPLPLAQWLRYSEGLKAACHRYELRADHGLTANAAGVLRLPGTTNHKLPGKPRPVTLDPRYLDIGPYDLAQFEVLLGYAPQRKTGRALSPLPPRPPHLIGFRVPPEAFSDPDSKVDIGALAAECGVVAEFQRTGGCREPTWKGHAGLFHYVENGEELFHEYSARNYPKYDRRQTQEKFDRAAKLTGPTRCKSFKDDTDGKTREICLACPHLDRVPTPIHAVPDPEDPEDPESPESAGTATTGAKRALVWKMFGKKIKDRSYHNTMQAIEALGITGCHDTFHDHKIVSGDLIEHLGPELSDAIVRAVRETIVIKYGFDPGADITRGVLDRLCEKNQFDPVRDYLDGLKWDGAPRLDRWLITYMSAEDTDLNRAFGRKVLIAGVRRVRRPGCKFDYLLVLEGVEGTFKSTALRILAGDENYSDQLIKWDNPKQQREATRSPWIHEVPEMAGMKKAEVEAIKSFLSRQDDRERSAYDRLPTSQLRHGIHIGTTNSDSYLNNATGARRFWPVKTGRIDLARIKADRDQLWAEAAHWETTEEELTIPDNLHGEAKAQQEMRSIHDPWMDDLEPVKGERTETPEGPVMMRVSSAALLARDLRLEPYQRNSVAWARVKVVMRKLGWDGPKLIRLPEPGTGGKKLGDREKGYERPETIQPMRDDGQNRLS